MGVSKVGGKGGHALLHIHTHAIPGEEGLHRKAVAKVVQAGTMVISRAAKTNLA
jgi:hypothetical protein